MENLLNRTLEEQKNDVLYSLKTEHEKLLDKLREINFYKSMVRIAKKSRLEELAKQQTMSETIKITKDLPDFELFQMSNLVYKDIRGDCKSLGFIDKNIDEIIESIEYQHNKQYQWFLVEIFELYIKFIENSYQTIQQLYPDIFVLKKNEKKVYYNIISKLKKNDNLFESFENGRFFATDMNYFHYMQMIKELRDSIVHQQGHKTTIDTIYDDMKKHLNDSLNEDFKEIIAVYFGTGKFANMICLNEISTTKHCHSDRLGFLIGIVIVYAELILHSFKRVIHNSEVE